MTIRVTGMPIAAFVRAIVLATKSATMDIFGLDLHLAMLCEVTFGVYSTLFICVAPMLFDKGSERGPGCSKGMRSFKRRL